MASLIRRWASSSGVVVVVVVAVAAGVVAVAAAPVVVVIKLANSSEVDQDALGFSDIHSRLFPIGQLDQSKSSNSVAFEFDSNCQALGGLAVRVEFKCFVSPPFLIVFGAIFDRFRQNFQSFSVSFRFVFDRFRLVFGSF